MSLLSLAQIRGLPYFQRISIPKQLGEPRITFIDQMKDGTMIMGASSGLLMYDGNNWNHIATPDQPRSVLINELNGDVYVATRREVFKLEASDTSLFELRTVLKNDSNELHGMLRSGAQIVCHVGDNLIILDEGEEPIPFNRSKDKVTGIVDTDLGIAAITSSGKIYLVKGDIAVEFASIPGNRSIAHHTVIEAGTVILTNDNELYLLKDQGLSRIKGPTASFCKGKTISGITTMSDSLIAISTRSAGFIIAEPVSGKIHHRANYGTGFPDNEVLCSGSDRSGGLWISYDSELIRVDMSVPITTLTGYPGLDGKLLAACEFNNALVVATSTGLFHLTTTSDRKEVERIKELETTQGFGPDLGLTPTLEPRTSVVKGGVMGALGGPGGSKSNGPDILPPGASIPGMERKSLEPAEIPSSTETPAVKKNISEKRILFKRIDGISLKCRELFVHNDKLYVVSNDGLYQVDKQFRASRISKKNYIVTAEPADNGAIFYSTTSGVFRLTRSSNEWRDEAVRSLDGIHAFSIVSNKEELWIGSDNSVYRYGNDDDLKKMNVPGFGNERIIVVEAYSKPHFLSSSGVYHHLEAPDSVVTASIPGIGGANRYRYLIGSNGQALAMSNNSWNFVSASESSASLPYANLLNDISGFSVVYGGSLLVIDNEEAIYRIGSSPNRKEAEKLNVSVRSSLIRGKRTHSASSLSFEHNEGGVSFGFSAPSFLKDNSTQFQYRINGSDQTWSTWTTSSDFDLPFVTPGEYQLQVRAMNALGEISDVTHVPFKVKQPVWVSWYMLVLYVLLCTAIIWLLIKWRTHSLQASQRELEQLVTNRTAALEEQKEEVEKLLLNILPKETAEELQAKGRATPRQYNSATVLFTDFKDFTRITGQASAEELVSELDRYFVKFDQITEKYGLEKIKTIGDSYMCASGIPVPSAHHAIACVLAAIEMVRYMDEVAESKKARGLEPWQIRIGIHTGPLMAGVVGQKKFAYDVWGDTVNIASRMESSSEAGKVNVSTATYGLVNQVVETIARGKVVAKGKGEMDMYFVTGLKPAYSENGEVSRELLAKLQNATQNVN